MNYVIFKIHLYQMEILLSDALPSRKRQPKSVAEEKTKSCIEYKLILNRERSSVLMALLSYM